MEERREENIKKIEENISKRTTYLRGFLIGAELKESMKALQFSREKHAGQVRKTGVPYIMHPLRMACYAIALGIRDDNIIATILLHDVVEDCNIPLSSLPVNDTIRRSVNYMTFKILPEETKEEAKKRYYNQLIESREALICKAIDRYDNLSDMVGVLNEEAVRKNIRETAEYLLPVLKKGKEKWVDLSNIIFVLRTNLRTINDILDRIYNGTGEDCL